MLETRTIMHTDLFDDLTHLLKVFVFYIPLARKDEKSGNHCESLIKALHDSAIESIDQRSEENKSSVGDTGINKTTNNKLAYRSVLGETGSLCEPNHYGNHSQCLTRKKIVRKISEDLKFYISMTNIRSPSPKWSMVSCTINMVKTNTFHFKKCRKPLNFSKRGINSNLYNHIKTIRVIRSLYENWTKKL
ncbi:hypothetical protein K501DRAFT_273948 [Backusella circina FSU 941]|nr:hypothetical protein K501DRAFT_273948 [Backusella circina FSU 941]